MTQLVAIDGSSHSTTVLDWALDNVFDGDEVVAMLIWSLPSVGGFTEPFRNLNEAQFQALRLARSIVDSVVRQRWANQRPSVPVRIDVRHGDPCSELVRASSHADMMVLGGYRGKEADLGPVATCVVSQAQCTVALVPLVSESVASSAAQTA